jgi:hypothetical protein
VHGSHASPAGCGASSMPPPTLSWCSDSLFRANSLLFLHRRHLDSTLRAYSRATLPAYGVYQRESRSFLTGSGSTSIGFDLERFSRDREPLYRVHAAQTRTRHAAQVLRGKVMKGERRQAGITSYHIAPNRIASHRPALP